MAAFAADTAFDQAVALRATLHSQGNFSLRAGSDHHFKSFLELFRQRPGSKERGKLAEDRCNLKRLARRVRRPPCRFTGPVPIHDNQTATHLYRIAQEAITNALKHRRANHITVSLEAHDAGVTLSIRDDGIGLVDQADATSGMGLKIMRYRASLIVATFSVETADDGGTLVTCTVARSTRHEHAKGVDRMPRTDEDGTNRTEASSVGFVSMSPAFGINRYFPDERLWEHESAVLSRVTPANGRLRRVSCPNPE